MTEALINYGVLNWAAQRAHASADFLADRMHVSDPTRVQAWLAGKERPSFVQAQKLASILHIPFGYLFLASPPAQAIPIPDLRTIGNKARHEISPDLHDVLSDVLYKHEWYKNHLLETGAEPLSFVGRFEIGSSVARVAKDITATLRLSMADRQQVTNVDQFRKRLISRCEEIGIWILCNGVVGTNTHRALDFNDFRGFAIADPISPVVFLNGTDAKAAQIFTLVHELAHLWIGQSGISDLGIDQIPDQHHGRIETFCNRVAGEVLVPKGELMARWRSGTEIDFDVFREQAQLFRVSPVMVARRCVDLDLISWPQYSVFYEAESQHWQRSAASKGGNFYLSVPIRNGRKFMTAVLQQALAGDLLFRDAGQLLNLKPAKIRDLADRSGL